MKNSWTAGDQVFYVPNQEAVKRLGGQVSISSTSVFSLPAAIQKELDAGHGIKLRAVVDRVLSDRLRLTLAETYDTVIADYDEVELLDVVTRIGDTLNSKTLEEQLAEAKAFEANGPDTVTSRNTLFKRSKARIAVRCVVCKDRQESGAIVYKPAKSGAGCGWTSSARFCLRCVLEERAPLTRPSA
jgi:hypothetical protein